MNLKHGIPNDCSELTCTAGVGTLLLEFGIFGRLIGDPKFELIARKALDSLWKFRSSSTGLFGKFLFELTSNDGMLTWKRYYYYLKKHHAQISAALD